jgi:hypothetical protein
LLRQVRDEKCSLLSSGLKSALVGWSANKANAIAMAVNRPAYRDQCIGLTAGTTNGRVTDRFAIAAKVSVGQIHERRLLHSLHLKVPHTNT